MARAPRRDAQPKPAAGAAVAFRDRIIDFKRVKAGELRANMKNWRRHPESQKGALRAILQDIGFVGALVARKVGDTLELIDGHLRADVAANAEVPVLIVDLSDEEAAKVLATFDPLSSMALTDKDVFGALVKDIEFDNAELRNLLAGVDDTVAEEQKKNPDEYAFDVPGMELQPHEHYDYLVVLATTTHEWNVICDKLNLKPTPKRHGRMGMCRAIRADKLLQLLADKGKGDGKAG